MERRQRMTVQIKIPYAPRYPQDEIHQALETHRFVVLVAHRRMGKTVLSVNHLIKRAIVDAKERGFYAYIAPFRNQAEQIAWGYLKHYTAPIPMCKVNEQKLSITLPNGVTIRIYGADNPDALRGAYFDGVVLDEVAQMKPEVWGEILRPALADRKGWAVFIGTPKGINLFSQMYDKALERMAAGDPEWIAMLYSVDRTHVIPDNELQALKLEMSENEFRQEFMCDFNAAADNVLISIDTVRVAACRQYREHDYAASPRILGVDVARFGSDASVIFKRQGVVSWPPTVIRKLDNMALADQVAIQIREWQPDAVFIDIGNGAGVVDRLRQLRFDVTEVAFAGASSDPHYANKRMEMWAEMAKWLQDGGAIPPDTMLQADLSAPTYGYTTGKGLKILESKDKIKERIGRSPDLADALALTFAAPVAPKLDQRLERQLYGSSNDYDANEEFDRSWR
nr:MAG TPA: Large subunit terminase [Caudoviricetes sp.]